MATKIRISGWKPGVKTVSLHYLLREQGGYSLTAAKHAMDDMVAGRLVEFEIPDEKASRFIDEAKQLGAIASILPPE